MINDDEYLERVVAGIQDVTTNAAGAEVSWNQKIGGRQFDVVMRFDIGTMKFLVLIEVKNKSRSTQASEVEAFITKAKDKLANKMVFVTVAGYQKEAIAVAKSHGVELYRVAFDTAEVAYPHTMHVLDVETKKLEKITPSFVFSDKKEVTIIVGAEIQYTDGQAHKIPTESSQMNYYVQKTKLADGRCLDDLVRNTPMLAPSLGKTLTQMVLVEPPQAITPPDQHFFPAGTIRGIKCTLKGDYYREVSGDIQVDPSVFTSPVVFTNVITNEAQTFPLYNLPLGAKQVEPGKFYFQYDPLRYMHCAQIAENTITWEVVESFQCGHLARYIYKDSIKYCCLYIPVTDGKILKRLQARLAEFRALQEAQNEKLNSSSS